MLFQEYIEFREYREFDHQLQLNEDALGVYTINEAYLGVYTINPKEIKQDVQASYDQIVSYSKEAMTTGAKGGVRQNWRNANYAHWTQPENAREMVQKATEYIKDRAITGMKRANGRTMLRDYITAVWQKTTPTGRSRGAIRGMEPHPQAHQAASRLGISEPPLVTPGEPKRGVEKGKWTWESEGEGKRTKYGKRKMTLQDPRYPKERVRTDF